MHPVHRWVVFSFFAGCSFTARAADIKAVLDTSDGSSAFAVTDAQTNLKLRVQSDGILVASNIVDGISGQRPAITVVGGQDVQIGAGSDGYSSGAAVGGSANGAYEGAAVGVQAKGQWSGAGMGYQADGANQGVAVGRTANGNYYGTAVGNNAQGTNWGVAMGGGANGINSGVAIGFQATGGLWGVSVGYRANSFGSPGYDPSGDEGGVAVGYQADGGFSGAAVGYRAVASPAGAALGLEADAQSSGAAFGHLANAATSGVAIGFNARGEKLGVAVGGVADGRNCGVAMGYNAYAANTNVAVGFDARTDGGTNRTAVGPSVHNDVDNSARLRGTLFLDGGTAVLYRATFGSGNWTSLADVVTGGNTSFVKKAGDTMSAPLVINDSSPDPSMALSISKSVDRGSGIRNLISIGGGSDVEIGANANGYFGCAVGGGADGSQSGVALGWAANGNTAGVALGGLAKGQSLGAAVGNEANANTSGAAVGYQSKGYGNGAAVGFGANGATYGVAVGYQAIGNNGGVAVGNQANGDYANIAVGPYANAGGGSRQIAIGFEVTNDVSESARLRGTLYLDGGTGVLYRSTFGNGTWTGLGESFVKKTGDTMTGPLNMTNATLAVSTNENRTGAGSRSLLTIRGGNDVEIGDGANAYWSGVALGYRANGYWAGMAMGYQADGNQGGVALGYNAIGNQSGVAAGQAANGMTNGAAVGREANGRDYGAAVGYQANGYNNGAAVGYQSYGHNAGVAMGYQATGSVGGVAMGWRANGSQFGAAVGRDANGSGNGVALGYLANGAASNVAVGAFANAYGGENRTAIGLNVTNSIDHSVRLRGSLYLDGGSAMYTNSSFGKSDWNIKAFTISHPLDPENKVLRHFCLEGPEVWNVYAGNVQLASGEAVVELPDYYAALNLVGSEIYQLTPVGDLAQLCVKEKVADNRFVIRGDKDVEVSWTIKVRRNDPACLEDLQRRPVEQLRSEVSADQMQAENRTVNTGAR